MPTTSGVRHFRHRRIAGHGPAAYRQCVSNLLSGHAHRAAGAPLTGPLQVGGTVSIRPLGIRALSSPCRIITRDEGPRRTVLRYRTLPGHLVRGEESFTVELLDEGTVAVTVAAFSRPAHWLTVLGGPVARGAQRLMARRYARAISRRRPRPTR